MRNYLKKSGLTTVILITLAAIVFLQKNVAQWVVGAALLTWGSINGIIYYLNHKERFTGKRTGKTSAVNNVSNEKDADPFEFKYAVRQLSHRVTDKLHSAFPDGTWQWTDKPDAELFINGGRIRIATANTEEYNEADVILDAFGRIDLKMLKTNSVADIIRATDNNGETNYTVDVQMWYEQRGQQVLTDLITDLNARGTKILCINEDGSIVIGDDKQVGQLQAFPAKNLWKQLIGIFEESGLKAVENEHSIELGW